MTNFFHQADYSDQLYSQIYDKSCQDFQFSFSKVISSETKDVELIIVKICWPEFGLKYEDLVYTSEESGWIFAFYTCILTKSLFYLKSLKTANTSKITLTFPWCGKSQGNLLNKVLDKLSVKMNHEKPKLAYSSSLKSPPFIDVENQIIWEAEGLNYEPLFHTIRWGKDLLSLSGSIFENLGNLQVDKNLRSFLMFCQNLDVPIIAPEVDATKRSWLLKNRCSLFVKNDVFDRVRDIQ